MEVGSPTYLPMEFKLANEIKQNDSRKCLQKK